MAPGFFHSPLDGIQKLEMTAEKRQLIDFSAPTPVFHLSAGSREKRLQHGQ
jgi:hypothetical protein